MDLGLKPKRLVSRVLAMHASKDLVHKGAEFPNPKGKYMWSPAMLSAMPGAVHSEENTV